MSECFVKLPVEVLESPDLEPLDKLTWCAIASFRFNGQSTCFPGMKAIRDRLGLSRCKRQILRSIQKLTDLGFLEIVKKENGRPNEYRPSLPVTPMSLVTPESPLPPQTSDTHVTSDVHVTPPVTPMSPEEDVLKKIFNSPPIIPPSERGESSLEVSEMPIKKKKAAPKAKKEQKKVTERALRKKAPLLKDPEKLQEALLGFDLTAYQEKWGDSVDVEMAFYQFKQCILHGTAKKPWPNPYDWRAFDLAFDNWCSKRVQGFSATNNTDPNRRDPAHGRPQLTPEQVEEVNRRIADAEAKAKSNEEKETQLSLASIERLPVAERVEIRRKAKNRLTGLSLSEDSPGWNKALELAMIDIYRKGESL
jgi:hypothetical protein